MGRKFAPVNVIMYHPKTEEGKQELAERVADVHANAIVKHIAKLQCPYEQKIALHKAVTKALKNK